MAGSGDNSKVRWLVGTVVIPVLVALSTSPFWLERFFPTERSGSATMTTPAAAASTSGTTTKPASSSSPAPPTTTAVTPQLNGTVSIGWTTVDGVGYWATVTVAAASGSATVTFTDPWNGSYVTVGESLQLAESDGTWTYAGYAPYLVSGTPTNPVYNPDVFVLTSAAGDWVIGQVCDIGGCYAVISTG